MALLALYLGITVVGYFLGAQLRKKEKKLKGTGIIQTVAITLLVFVMGSRIGADKEIVASLDSIGLTAFILTIFILAGTLASVFVVRKILGFNKFGDMKKTAVPVTPALCRETERPDLDATPALCKETETPDLDATSALCKETDSPDLDATPALCKADESDDNLKVDHTMTICIVASVAIGILAGYFIMPEWFVNISGTLITIGLCILLLFVGIDIGTEGTIGTNFKQAGWRIFLFPFASMIGTYIGALVACIFLDISIKDAFCVGSGFSWYTLAPAMLAEYSVKVSALSFMHNVMRELIGILMIPIVARRVGFIETTCLPGAAAMDVCLPIVERATKADIAVYSFISGVTLSIAVPIMVSFMMGL